MQIEFAMERSTVSRDRPCAQYDERDRNSWTNAASIRRGSVEMSTVTSVPAMNGS
jgi:hypothetical protein